ncbi:MAG: FRG domain-containing protein [Bacteroidales bacterium]|nr:FRG domain-containing protein [Bacteroidales bacterium]
MYDTIKIKDFSHLISLIEDDTKYDLSNKYNGITLYRGQNCDKPLLPKISRYKKTVPEILEIEAKLIDEFVKRCQPYLGFEPDNEWDFLAYAQHFGLPTRLLDWTENPLIALWFAISKESDDNDYSVVWIFDVDDEDIVFDLDKDPFEIKKTKVFDPNHINKRISSQSGWFTVHMLSDKTKKNFIPLERNRTYNGQLRKLIIPKSLNTDFRLILNKMGVNQATIFSDLDGLCNHLAWLFL